MVLPSARFVIGEERQGRTVPKVQADGRSLATGRSIQNFQRYLITVSG